MGRTHDRTLRGERLRLGVPHSHWKTTSVVGALTTPFVLSGLINRDAFEASVDRVLTRERRAGDLGYRSSQRGPWREP
ncbi:MAG: hypothetical protein AAGC57_12400 [Pseudomonadota bacterium]